MRTSLLAALSLLIFSASALSAEEPIPWKFPKEASIEKGKMVIHAPQVIAWDDFETAQLIMVIELHPKDDTKVICATVQMSGKTDIDMEQRIVSLTDRKVVNVNISGEEYPAWAEKLSAKVRDTAVVAELDVFLVSVAQDVFEPENQRQVLILTHRKSYLRPHQPLSYPFKGWPS